MGHSTLPQQHVATHLCLTCVLLVARIRVCSSAAPSALPGSGTVAEWHHSSPHSAKTPTKNEGHADAGCAPEWQEPTLTTGYPFPVFSPRPRKGWACSSDNCLPPQVPGKLRRASLPPHSLTLATLGILCFPAAVEAAMAAAEVVERTLDPKIWPRGIPEAPKLSDNKRIPEPEAELG